MKILLSSAYNAPIQYYSKFLLAKDIYIEQYDTYVKQSYRNRCVIATADGPMSLSIPVEYSAKERTKTKDVRISDHGNWQHTHWNALVSAYSSSPFFEYYKDEYEKFYRGKYEYLFDFNEQLMYLNLENLKIDDVTINTTQSYFNEDSSGLVDFREQIHPKKPISLDKSFKPIEYYQVFAGKSNFSPNMSILDLLFNMGNESLLILHNSAQTINK